MTLLFRYFSLKILLGILALWFFIGMVVSILNLLEILARFGDYEDASLILALKIMLMKMPDNFRILLPFAMVMGTALSLLMMRHSNEFVIMVMSGLRQFRMVSWLMLVGLSVSGMSLLLDNFAAKSMAQYRFYELNALSLQLPEFEELFINLNFYYKSQEAHYYIILHRFDSVDNKLGRNTIVVSDAQTNKLRMHIVSKQGKVLANNMWQLENVTLYYPDGSVEKHSEYTVPIIIEQKNIVFLARPLDTIGFFSLPHFIELAKQLGVQASLYQASYLQKIINPVLYTIFVILTFGIVRLVSPRQSIGLVLVKCFLWALLLTFFSHLIMALGSAEQISLPLSLGIQLLLPAGIATIFLMQPGIR
ncbi:MAG: LptF/LptG family permease [Alphaproteobacteria bacterium]|nr:LptF/LptG family permease [Alphaproteobacteria bacterium]